MNLCIFKKRINKIEDNGEKKRKIELESSFLQFNITSQATCEAHDYKSLEHKL